RQPEHAGGEQTDQDADERKVAQRACRPARIEGGGGGHGQARQELRGTDQKAKLLPHAFFSLTPALAKVAMSLKGAAAARTIGSASALPVPSPSRMRRSSRGLAPSSPSSVRCPRSAEQWA